MGNKDELETILTDFDSLLQKNVETELYCDRMTFAELREWQKQIEEINQRLHNIANKIG
jgi:hypothetical protein